MHLTTRLRYCLTAPGTFNRNEIYNDLLGDAWSWREMYSNYICILGGDFNVDLDSVNQFSTIINNVISNLGLSRCDLTFPTATKHMNINDALNCRSTTDYFLISDISKVCQFDIVDHDSNISDHLPLYSACKSAIFESIGKPIDKDNANSEVCVERYRWNHGDLLSYYNATRQL